MRHKQPLTYITEIYKDMVKQIDPAYLIPPDMLEIIPLTKKSISEEGVLLQSGLKTLATSEPNKFFIKQSWGSFKEVRNDLLIQAYSTLIEAKNEIPIKIISDSIPHLIILSENQRIRHKIDIVIWQQLFEKGDIFLGRRACLNHKQIDQISLSNCDLNLLGEEKQEINLGSYWAGFIASYAIKENKDILEIYFSSLNTLFSDRIINFPFH
ncbi:transaldolase [Candidatus Scalindua japonica]|uniref:Transaldolase n=1 Tax=Candidatus Scalindua japonica TaxID=1284222 RepID=A0A286TTN1_9BACT|nr:hypothetical protein [Candidatus Scalindua japonica]GAX59242.1 transaldolase [Candidatus Scalindua japonica]